MHTPLNNKDGDEVTDTLEEEGQAFVMLWGQESGLWEALGSGAAELTQPGSSLVFLCDLSGQLKDSPPRPVWPWRAWDLSSAWPLHPGQLSPAHLNFLRYKRDGAV